MSYVNTRRRLSQQVSDNDAPAKTDSREFLGAALGIALGGMALALIFARSQGDSYDAGIMAQVAQSIVRDHNFVVHSDIFHFNTPYASYGIGMSLLMVPAFIVGPAIHIAPEKLYAAVNSGVFAFSLAALFALAVAVGASRRQAVIASLLVGLGTPMLVYAATSFSELGTGLGVALGLLGIQLSRQRRVIGPFVAGAGTALSVLMRPESLLLVLPIVFLAAWLAGGRTWLTLTSFAIGLFPGIAVTFAYNVVRFGRPDTFGYSGFGIFNHPFLTGLSGLLFSPGRGLVIYAPVVLIAVVGLPFAWRRSKVLTSACVLLLVARLLFFAPYFAWYGGTSWGPRFLVPALPALLPLMVEVVVRMGGWSRVAQTVIVAIAILSIGVQVVGASVKVESEQLYANLSQHVHFAPDYSDFQQVYTSRAVQDLTDDFMFDVRYFPVVDAAGKLAHGQDLNGHVPGSAIRPTFAALGAISIIAFLVALMPMRRRRTDNTAVCLANPRFRER